MKNLILVLLVLISTCCSDEHICCSGSIVAGTGVHVVNKLGEDLLNPNHPDAINFEDIDVLHLIDGQEIKVYNAHAAAPKGISLRPPNKKYNKYYMNLWLNRHFDEGTDINYTIVQWNESERDVFKVEYDRRNNNNFVVAMKCWLNGELLWDASKQERFFTLVK